MLRNPQTSKIKEIATRSAVVECVAQSLLVYCNKPRGRAGSADTTVAIKRMLKRLTVAATSVLLSICGCGGSSDGPVLPASGGGPDNVWQTGSSGGVGGALAIGANVVPAVVDQGPPGLDTPYTNGLFVTATVCAPGTSDCQIIDHLLVDTGSVGLRVLGSVLTLALPATQDAATGLALAECLPFIDGSSWGTVNGADLRIGGETASALSIQVIGEQSYPVPSDCTGTPANDLNGLGANGILGVGSYLNDCGTDCAQPAISRFNPGLYYSCSSAQAGGCQVTSVPVALQVLNPVAAFPADNNGVIIQLPALPAAGAPSASGVVVFGIGTQANNGLGSAAVFALDVDGYVETTFPVGGIQYTSYLDSGSNALFFLDRGTTGIPLCPGDMNIFYCPTVTTNLNATIMGGSTSANVSFSVANAAQLAARDFAFNNLAGPMGGYPDPQQPSFDWGLPFFFGRSVFTAIEEQPTPAGSGPYFAF